MKKNLLALAVMIATISSCVTSTEKIDQIVDDTLISEELNTTNFSQTKIHIELKTQGEEALSGVLIKLWGGSPLAGGTVIFKSLTNNEGSITSDYNLPAHLESVVLEISQIGMPNYLIIPVDQLDQVIIKGTDHGFEELEVASVPGQSFPQDGVETGSYNARIAAAPVTYLSTYNADGVPDVMETPDVVSSELLSFISASLPEGAPVPVAHPSYLAENAESNLIIEAQADVWMTFVHEGAGYKNVLAFYTYPTGNPPNTADEIDSIVVAFPNASFLNSGGALQTGYKVHLGTFEAGTTMGFALLANGWNGTEATYGNQVVYSNNNLNPESTAEKRYHSVLLYDDVNELFVVGLEDLNRDGSSDDDFNDAVFYLTANPIEAINRTNVNPIDKPVDADGDGVNDTYDEYPDDPRYAYMYSYPGEGAYGTFAFEDQWPNKGDYDFNDLVADYQYRQIANASNQMVKLEAEYVIKAVGAGFKNGFGVQLDIAPSTISQVSGNYISSDLFALNANGTEAGQTKAVIPVTDDAHAGFEGRGFINTDESLAYQDPDTITVSVEFNSGITLSGAGVAPFNPFLVINNTRGRELHMPGYAPTDLVNTDYFGTVNDATDLGAGIYYKTQVGLPWGMNLPLSFDYPKEKTDVREGYNNFNQWAQSGGFSFMDWYVEKTGYRNPDRIYKKQ